MSEERLDAVLRELSAHPIQMGVFYENHYDEIVRLEKRCLVEVDWDDIRIKDARVTELGRQFLMQGGFKEEATRNRRTNRTAELAESRESREIRTEKRSTWSLRLSILNLVLLALGGREGVVEFLSLVWNCVKGCWRALTDLF